MTNERQLAFSHITAQAFLRKHLKLRQLRLLVALDHHRHVGRVADALHITQPAVSKALAELERGLGMSLFTRTPQGLLPTQEGVCLIRYAQSVDEDLNRTALALSLIGQAPAWRLAVGAGHGTTPMLSMAFNCLQRRRTPTAEFNLTVQEGPVDLLLPLLRAGKIDILMGPAPGRMAAANLHIVPLYADPLVWIVARDHALASKTSLTLKDLSNTIWVLPPNTSRLRVMIDSELRKQKLPIPSRLVETSSFDTLLGMVCDHGAVGLLSRRRARSAESRGLVHVLDIPMENLITHISAMTLDAPEPNSYLDEFVQCLIEVSAH